MAPKKRRYQRKNEQVRQKYGSLALQASQSTQLSQSQPPPRKARRSASSASSPPGAAGERRRRTSSSTSVSSASATAAASRSALTRIPHAERSNSPSPGAAPDASPLPVDGSEFGGRADSRDSQSTVGSNGLSRMNDYAGDAGTEFPFIMVDRHHGDGATTDEASMSTTYQDTSSHHSQVSSNGTSWVVRAGQMASQRGGERSGQLSMSQRLRPAPRATMRRLETVPLDWSLPEKIKVQSSLPFQWASGLASHSAALAIAEFTQRHASLVPPHLCAEPAIPTSDPAPQPTVRDAVDFHKTLLHFRYAPPPPPGQASSNKSDTSDPVADRAHKEWVESFESVYGMFQANVCDHVYYHGRQFAVLFLNVDGSSQALLAHATPALRKRLEEYDVAFRQCQPDLPPKVARETSEEYEQLRADVPSLTSTTRRLSASAGPPPPYSSVLHFEGRESVHALSDFLTEHRHSQRGMYEPASLLAPVAFLRAALGQMKVEFLGPVKRSNSDGSGTETVHTIEMQGVMLPFHTVLLMTLLQRTQKGSFQTTINPHLHTVHFNAPGLRLPSTPSACGQASEPQSYEDTNMAVENLSSSTALGAPEWNRLLRTNGVLSGRWMSQVLCTDGTFELKTDSPAPPAGNSL